MNTARIRIASIKLSACAAVAGTLAGCVGYVDQPRQRVYYDDPAPPPVVYYDQPQAAPVYYEDSRAVPSDGGEPRQPDVGVEVVIRSESDFYEPLQAYGRWQVVGSYGRCWVPGRVDAEWRPYCDGSWRSTDAGWYWMSEEPWGWATYHYGRWDFSASIGWFWMPQIVWGPAWVSWFGGGGYVGWAPMGYSARGGHMRSSRDCVFVEERRFLEPVRRSTVVINNTTVINKTTVYAGPRRESIERASGHAIHSADAHDLRRHQESPVISRHHVEPTRGDKGFQAPDRGNVDTRGPGRQPDADRHVGGSDQGPRGQPQRDDRGASHQTPQQSPDRQVVDPRTRNPNQQQNNVRTPDRQVPPQQQPDHPVVDPRTRNPDQQQNNVRTPDRQIPPQQQPEHPVVDPRTRNPDQQQNNVRTPDRQVPPQQPDHPVVDPRTRNPDQQQNNVRTPDRQVPPKQQPEHPVVDPRTRSPQQQQMTTRNAEQAARLEAERRAAELKMQADRNTRAAQQHQAAQHEIERQANETRIREQQQQAARSESERRANESRMRDQQQAVQREAERRANETRVREQQQQQVIRNAQDQQRQAAQQDAERRANESRTRAQQQQQQQQQEQQNMRQPRGQSPQREAAPQPKDDEKNGRTYSNGNGNGQPVVQRTRTNMVIHTDGQRGRD